MNATYFLPEKDRLYSGRALTYSLMTEVKGSNLVYTTRERINVIIYMHRATVNAAIEAHSEERGRLYPACMQLLHHAGCISKSKHSCSISYVL